MTSSALMTTAIRQALGPSPAVRHAESEARKLADTLATITRLREAGEIDEAEAATLLRMQAEASTAVLLTVQGTELISAQLAINAALEAVRGIVVKAAGTFF